MRRKLKALVVIVALLVGGSLGMAHSKPDHHNQCSTSSLHGITYDFQSGGLSYYHNSYRQTPSIWPGGEWDNIYDHYYYSGSPYPHYVYAGHYTRVTCW